MAPLESMLVGQIKASRSAFFPNLRLRRTEWGKRRHEHKAEIQKKELAIANLNAVVPDTVLFESFAGNGALCNPEAIFRAILLDPRLNHLRLIWALDKPSNHSTFVNEFADVPRVTFVKRKSSSYARWLLRANYLVNNATFPPKWGKRPGQVFVNTWHGTPFKAMGFDMIDGATKSANVVRNFLATDYFVSPNEFTSERMFADSYKMRGIYRGEIIETGSPRNDLLFNLRDDIDSARVQAERYGFPETHGKRVVLFAPTWRGESFENPDNFASQLLAQTREIQDLLGSEWTVLLKVHQVMYSLISAQLPDAHFLVPNDVPTNVALASSDVLVTDYSSIFFDYLITGRPIVYFAPDLREYSHARGFLFECEELPGPICESASELVVQIRLLTESLAAVGHGDHEQTISPKGLDQTNYADRRVKALAKFGRDERGTSSQRVVDIVWHGNREGSVRRLQSAEDRESFLIYGGSMRSNGITSSVINLVNSLVELDLFDITLAYPRTNNAEALANAARIDSRVRVYPLVAPRSDIRSRMVNRRRPMTFEKAFARRVSAESRREAAQLWRSNFGDATFDYIINFSGYSEIATWMLAAAPSGIKSIWLHNDMESELKSDRNDMGSLLPLVFQAFPEYDNLVSVSPALAALNEDKLRGWSSPSQHRAARNLIRAHDILQSATAAIDSELPIGDSPDAVWFINIGRLSGEKNQSRLLAAFKRVNERYPNTRLCIVGDGPLRSQLESQVTSLELDGVAVLAGSIANPMPLLAKSDCFVLSSDYEGQPMVLLEAMVLEKPIISTRFSTVGSALKESQALIVDRSEDALFEGMCAFLEGQLTSTTFDSAQYVNECLAEFYAAVGRKK